MSLFVRQAFYLVALAWVSATNFLLGTVHLFKADLPVDEDTDPATLTEADYTGYAEETLTWHVASISDDGVPELVSDPVVFRPTATTVGNTVYGVLIKTAGGVVHAQARFKESGGIAMNATTDEVMGVVRWRLTEAPRFEIIS